MKPSDRMAAWLDTVDDRPACEHAEHWSCEPFDDEPAQLAALVRNALDASPIARGAMPVHEYVARFLIGCGYRRGAR